ncbi:MAG: TolC family protein [Candidatus Krumholzibacteriales bacterium]
MKYFSNLLLRILFACVLISSVFPVAEAAEQRDVLSLDECLHIALRNNPDIGISYQGIRKAESALLQSYGRLMPDFSLDLYTGHTFYGPSTVQYDEQGRPIQSSGFDFENYTMRLNANLMLWQGGSNYSNISSAREMREAAEADYEYTKDMITAGVIRAYYNVVRNRMLFRVQKESRRQAARNLERAEALMEAGSATRADVLKAKVRHSNTRLGVIGARNNLVMAKEELKKLMKVGHRESFRVDTTMNIIQKETDPDREINSALNNRDDIKVLEHRLKAQNSEIASARGGWFPSLGLNFNYSWNDRDLVDNPIDVFREEYQWSVTGYLRFNIFDGMQTSSRVKTARADFRIAEYNLEKSRLEVENEVKKLIFAMNEAEERIEVAGETVLQASEEVRLADERYRVGAGTMLEIIDAQVSLATARGELIKAKCDYLIAYADLERATGRMDNEY